MKPCKAQRAVGLVIALLAIFGPLPALAQIASKPGDAVGTAGGACNSSIMTYGWPDANGNILKCVSNIWQLQGITASAGGSNTQVQYNSGGALAGDSGLTYSNPNLTIGYGSIYIGTSASTVGTLYIGGVNGVSFPKTDSTFGGSIAIGPSALSQEPSLASTAFGNIAIGYQSMSNASMTTAAVGNVGLGYRALQGDTSGGSNVAIGLAALAGTSSGSQNVGLGAAALLSNSTGGDNNAVGLYTLASNTTGNWNNGFGLQALSNATTASGNSAFGNSAGGAIITGSNNTIMGFDVANITLTTGSNNILLGTDNTTDTYSHTTSTAVGIGQGTKPGTGDIAIGYQALQTNAGDNLGNVAIGSQTLSSASMTTAAIQNTAVGPQALMSNTTGSQNAAFGYQALQTNTSASRNTAIGVQAAQNIGSSASNNTAVGWLSLYHILGTHNVGIGASALQNAYNTIGTVAVGDSAGYNLGNGGYSTFIGANAGVTINGGTYNTVLGYQVANTTLTAGSNNILIGTNSAVDTPAAGTNNFLNIGNLIYGTSIGTAASPGNVGIGTTSPGQPLTVYSNSTDALQVIGSSSTSVGVSLKNTSSSGHNWAIHSTGASDPNVSNAFVIIDETASSIPFGIGQSRNISIGSYANAAVPDSIAIGDHPSTYGLHAMAFGESTIANGDYSITLGNQINTGLIYGQGNGYGNYSMAIGLGSTSLSVPAVTGTYSMGIFMGDQGGVTVSGNKIMAILGGNVGIGTTNPMSMLQVNGGEVQIGSSGASCTVNNAGALRYSGGSLTFCNASSWTAPTAAAAGSTGQVQFNNSGALGASSNLFWNNSNSWLGIGTTSPQYPLEVYSPTSGGTAMSLSTPGTGTNQQNYIDMITKDNGSALGTATNQGWEVGARGNAYTGQANEFFIGYWNGSAWINSMWILPSGYIGIGPSSPSVPLDIENSTNDAVGAPDLQVGSITPLYLNGNYPSVNFNMYWNGSAFKYGMGSSSNYGGLIDVNTSSGNMEFYTTPSAGNAGATATANIVAVINKNGNVGIGTTAPFYNLDVWGSSGNNAIARINAPTSQVSELLLAQTGDTNVWQIQKANSSDLFQVCQQNVGCYFNIETSPGYVAVGAEGAPASQFVVKGNATVGSSYSETAAPANGLLVQGNVGIGTTSPLASLQVYGGRTSLTAASEPYSLLVQYNGATSGEYIGGTSTGNLQISGAGGGAQMTVTSGGNVGIGTTSPTDLLAIYGTGPTFGITPGSSMFEIIDSTSPATNTGGTMMLGGRVQTASGPINPEGFAGIKGGRETSANDNYAGYLAFYTASAGSLWNEAMRINSIGNVGIGNTGPSYRLDVTGSTTSHAAHFTSSDGAGNAYLGSDGTTVYAQTSSGSANAVYGYVTGSSSNGVYALTNNNAATAFLGNNTGSGYYCYIGYLSSYSLNCNGPTAGVSDRRLKKDIRPLESAEGLDAIMKIQPVHYRWKDDRMNTGHPNGEIGFIAQNVESVLPILVNTDPQPSVASIKLSDGKQKSLQYDRLIAPAVLAIQQLKALFDTDHDMLVKLKADNDNLRADDDRLRAANDKEAAQIKALTARLDTMAAKR